MKGKNNNMGSFKGWMKKKDIDRMKLEKSIYIYIYIYI